MNRLETWLVRQTMITVDPEPHEILAALSSRDEVIKELAELLKDAATLLPFDTEAKYLSRLDSLLSKVK